MRPPATLGRVSRATRAHPVRTALLAVLLVLGGAAVVLLPGRGSAPVAGPGAAPQPPGASGSGTAGGGGDAGTAAGPTDGATASTAGGTPPGAGTPTSRDPAGRAGSARPGGSGDASGVGGGAGGEEPGPRRPPVQCAPTGTPTAAPLPSPDERDGRRWVTVGRLTGNCDAASSPFRLQGIDTRLVWRSDADSFVVFLVDAAQGREATAGFADGECAGACSERQPIVPAGGEYILEVQAGDAPWEVEVQEYRRAEG